MKKLSESFRSSLRLFAYYYANGTLGYMGDSELLDLDYRDQLKDDASALETIFAIYSNNIEMDEEGNVLNHQYAVGRASEYIRYACQMKSDSSVEEPDFENWELALY